MKKKGKSYIGTSGWHYKHWKEAYYPADIKEKDQFAWYAQHFDTVEVNNSFYRLPALQTFAAWRKESPRGFIFAVKASRYLTHMVKLKVDKRSIRLLFSRLEKLEKKLGPILFQLPPRWSMNAPRLADFLKALPLGFRYTFEFRNHTWYTDEVLALLRQYNAAFCIYHLEGHQSPVEVTADFVYMRLHGPGNKYQGSYRLPALRNWASRCREWTDAGKDVYIYFDNDQAGYAARNAARLLELIKPQKR